MDPGKILARTSTLDCAREWIRTENGFKDDYQITWHGELLCSVIDEICENLGRRDGCRRFVIQLPTQHSKSIHFAEILPARAAGKYPGIRIMALGYGQSFAKRTVMNSRKIMTSEGYKGTYKTRVGSTKAIAGNELRNSGAVIDLSYTDGLGVERQGGQLLTGSMRAPPNGEPADMIIIDDPYRSWMDALSPAYNEMLFSSWDGTIKQRSQGPTVFVFVHTPWTNDDLVTRVMAQWDRSETEYKLIRLPALSREDTEFEESLGGRDYDERTELGQPLWPEKFGEEHYKRLYMSSTRRVIDAHLRLDPKDAENCTCPPSAWRYFDPESSILDVVALVCDPNGTEDGSSFCSAGVWDGGHVNEVPTLRRLAGYRAKPGYTAFKQAIVSLLRAFPEVTLLVIECTGHGQSASTDADFMREVRNALGREPEYKWTRPKVSKSTRHDVALSWVRNGQVYLPMQSHGRIDASWVHSKPDVYGSNSKEEREKNMGWIEEWSKGATPDDQQDEGAMAVEYVGAALVKSTPESEYLKALEALSKGGLSKSEILGVNI